MLLVTGCVSRELGPRPIAVPPPVPTAELSGLTLRVGDQKGGTEALLRAAGALDGLPYRVAFSTFTFGPPQIEALNAGRIDIAVTGNTPPIFGAAANSKTRVVAVWDGAGTGEQILVRTASPITNVGALRGKTVLVAKGSAAHGDLLEHLADAGLKPKDVKLIYLQPADALSAFANGQGDAWAIWDPYTAQANLTLKVRSIGSAANGYQFASASAKALSDPQRNAALADLLVRFDRAAQWARDHPDQWARKYSAAVGMSVPVATLAQSRLRRMPVPLDDKVVTAEQRLAEVFAAADQIPEAPDFVKWVDRRFNTVLRASGAS
ncbi:ABC transporter substrate-binding protein [Candidatus Mycobacterium wuenschmannii]|uniref:ABC transporter substrate-binding protein n=1 Tax=Candidatus Mycobacterium wuenschmannii TaxID=3027808 RepID=A0ABY8W991_9MYCO|nr:ABC transporter substrate-binding protein [Candidatus Mycobacterium wuenschmannii]WIM90339.1 ABC transporter substrate-binding protein [Candidatus Mycobacterium wuenschmannii]